MARRRTPTSILEARGSRHAKTLGRENEIEVVKPPECPPAPAWLSESAAPHWADIAPMLFARGLLTHLDTVKLALLCDRLAQYVELRDQIAREGWNTTNCEGGIANHPNVRAMNQSIKDIDSLAGRFGMSPTDRSGLVVDAPKAGKIIKTKFAKG